MLKKSYSIIAITLSAVLIGLTSCDIGLGNAIDLEAPVLEITSPGNNTFVGKKFAISGIAKDNTKTEEIRFVYSYSITDPVTGLSKKQGPFTRIWTDIDSQGVFSCPFDEFTEDTEIHFEITAFDKNRNGSEFSSCSITVIIDTSDIDVKEPRIKRDGYIARLLPISEFTDPDGRTAKRESTENKDYFQNKSFSLFTNISARYGVKNAKLSLFEVDENGNKIGEAFIANKAPDASANAYAPEFSFTSAEMTAAKDSLKTGLHYILPELVVVGNADQVTTICQNVFAWEEEYDIPHTRFSSMQNSVVKVPTAGNIPVSVFDDDGISSISYAIVNNTNFTDINSVPSSKFTTVNNFTPGLRDHTFDITAPAEDAKYKLILKIIDSTTNSATYFKAIELHVTNGEEPTIIIRSPEENSVPVLENGKFTIQASIVDNKPVSDIAVAWLPEGNSDIDKFTEYFYKTYSFSADEIFEGSIIHKLTSSEPYYDSNTNRYTSNVSKEWDFFKDFIKNGEVDNSNKVFMFAARDDTGNITTQTFRLNRFTSKPNFKIEYKQDVDSEWKTVDNPLITLSVKITEIKITPLAQNNMSIIACNATSKNAPQDASESESTGFTISQQWSKTNPLIIKLTGESDSTAPASGKNFNITLTATDQLNNSAVSKLTVAFDTLGNLTNIIATKEDNHTYTLNDEIVLQADFDNRVAIYPAGNNLPYIEFEAADFTDKNGTAVAPEKRRAVYDTNRNKNSSSNTFYFTYKVTDEVECKQLAIPVDNPINLNGATVEGTFTKTGAGTDFNNKKLKIDSIKPYLLKSEFVPAPDNVIKKENGQITIKLKFNENVTITSGSLVLKRTAGWYIPPVLNKEVFEDKIFLPASPDDRKTICGDDTKPFKYGKDKNGIDTIIAEGPYMQYTNGLKIPVTDTADVTPDLTTKYVLNYKYAIKELPNPDNSKEIEDHNTVVTNLRKVLENCGYHMATFDVQELEGNGTNTLSLTVKDSDFIDCLVNGVEYTLTLSDNSVRDDAYNYMDTGLAENDYKFLVGPVATPVIRVNRIATNGTDDQTCKTTKAKIDCVTPNVQMNYIIDQTRKDTMSTSTKKDAFVPTTTSNITASALKGLAENTNGVTAKTISFDGTKELSETLGADNYTTNAKIYIKATAEKTGFDNSLPGYEGAFKTVLRVYTQSSCNNVKDSKGKYCFAVFGSQIPEANSYTAGWPLSQNEPDYRKFQVAYKDNYNYYWSSWQILDNYCLQTLSSSYLNPAKTNVGFGQAILIYNPAIYGYTN